VVAAAACGKGVDDLSIPASPIVEVVGHVDLQAAIAASGGKPLFAAQ
jgi:hypothetical protein